MSWPMVKLGNVAPAKPLKKVSADADEDVWHLNLDMVEAQSGKILQKIYAPVADAGISTHWFDDNYVLYSKLRPYLNKVVLPYEKGLATTELVPMLPDPKRLDRKYLAYYLRSNSFVSWISEQVAGAKMPRVSMNVFWQHEIPLPPLEEQKRIAAILDKADAIRQKRQQAIELADEFLRSVFLDMFGDPVTNPKGWDVDSLGNHIQHANNGLSRRRATEENVGQIVLRLQDVHYDGIRYEKDLNRISLDEKEKERYLLSSGDVLFVRVNGNPEYVGRSAVFTGYKEPVYHNDHLIRLRVSESYSPYFLSFLLNLKGGRKIIRSKLKTSAGQYTVSQAGIESMQFICPDIELQNEFCEIKDKIYLNLKKQNKHLFSSEVCFNSLSQKAFSGEL